jgi:hypothetical protein
MDNFIRNAHIIIIHYRVAQKNIIEDFENYMLWTPTSVESFHQNHV